MSTVLKTIRKVLLCLRGKDEQYLQLKLQRNIFHLQKQNLETHQKEGKVYKTETKISKVIREAEKGTQNWERLECSH